MHTKHQNQRGRLLNLSTKLFLALLVATGSVVTASAQTTRIKLDDGIGGKKCDLFGNNPGTENAGPGNEMLAIDTIEIEEQVYAFIVGMNSDVENPGNPGNDYKNSEGPWQCHAYTVRLSGPDAPVLVKDSQVTNNTKGNQPCNKPHVVCVQEAGVCMFVNGNDEEDGSNVSVYGQVHDPLTHEKHTGQVLLSESNNNDNEGASSAQVVRKVDDGWLGILGYNDNGNTAAVSTWMLTNDLQLVRGTVDGNDKDLDLCNATIPRIYCEKSIDNDIEVYCSMRCGQRSDQNRKNGDGTYVYKLAVNSLNSLEEVSKKEVCKREGKKKNCSDGEIAVLPNGLGVVMAGTSGGPINNNNEKDRNNKGPSTSGLFTMDLASSSMDVMYNIQSIGSVSTGQTHPVFGGCGLCPDGESTCCAVCTSGRSDSARGMCNLVQINDDGTMEGVGTLEAGGIVAGGRTSNLCGANPNQEGREIGHAKYIDNPNFGVAGSQCPTSKGLWLWPHSGADENPENYKNAAYISVMCADGSDAEVADPEGDLEGTVLSDDLAGELAAADDGSGGGAGLCSAGSMSSGSALVWIFASIFGLFLARRRREEV